MFQGLKYALLVLFVLHIFVVNCSELQTTHQIDFERFKNLLTERYHANQEERYRQILRVHELAARNEAQEITAEESEELISSVIASHQEAMELLEQCGVDPESLSQKQLKIVIDFTTDIENGFIKSYRSSQSSELNRKTS